MHMNPFLRATLFAGLALGVCLLSSTVTRGDDEEEQEKKDKAEAAKAMDPLKKVIDAVETGKGKNAIAKATADLTANNQLKPIMWAAYKPREKGGLGVGDKPDAIKPDGIEAKLINMTKKPISDKQLEKEAAALIKIA